MAPRATQMMLKRSIELVQINIATHYLIFTIILLGRFYLKHYSQNKTECCLNCVVVCCLDFLYTHLITNILATHFLCRALKSKLENDENTFASNPIRLLEPDQTINPSIEIPNIYILGYLVACICTFSFFGCVILMGCITSLTEIKVWSFNCCSQFLGLITITILAYFPPTCRLCFGLVKLMLGKPLGHE